jgi:hypothetical protein
MADIKVTADITDIKQLNQLLDKTEAKVSQVATKSATAFGAYTKSVNGSLQAVRNKMTFSTRMSRQQSSEYAKATTEVNRQIALSKKFAAQKAQEEAVTAAAARNTANANRRLRMEFREGYAAQVQYRAGQMRLNQAQRLGMLTADQYKVQLASLHAQLLKNTVAGVANGERMRATGLVMQQTGYQVGDFLVQVQGGTNAMVAFGQQATQLAGLLTVLGKSTAMIALGAALSVLIPLTTAAAGVFLRARREADETTDSVNQLNSAIESLDSTLQSFVETKRAAAAGMTVAEMFGGDAIDSAMQDLNNARLALEQYRSSSRRLSGGYTRDGINNMERTPNSLLQDEVTAIEAVAAAEERLATLRAMQDEDTLAAFEAQDLALNNQLAMQQRIAQYGEDSNAVRQLQLSQSIDQYNSARDAQYDLNELTFDHAEQLKASYAELQRFNYTQESVLREQELAEQATERLADQMERAANAAMSFLDRIRSGVSGIAGLQAEVAALEAGATIGQASAAGDVANLRDDPAYQLLLAGGPTNELAQADALIAEAGRLIELKTTLQDRISELTRTESTGGSGSSGSSLSDQAAEAVASLQAQFTLQEALRGQTEEHILVRRALGDSYSQIGAAQIASLEEQARLIAVVTAADEQRVRINETVANSVGEGLTAMIEGTLSVTDAFKQMARSIIKELYDIFVVQQIVNGISGALGGGGKGKGGNFLSSILGSADGNVFSGGSQIQAYANGGVVDGPTYFPMSGSKTGLMGEAGPEAIMPLKRGSNGKLGVEASGGGSQAINITQNFSFSANGDESVKRIIAEAAPQIANITQKQIMDQRRRGGAMKSTFG